MESAINKFMPNKPPVKPTPHPAPAPVKPVVVTPPAPPVVWTRLDLPANTGSFVTNQFANHAGAIVSSFDANGYGIKNNTYGQDHINIFPPVGTWQEQEFDAAQGYQNTAVKFAVTQDQVNRNVASISMTLDGGVGPEKLMRYVKI